MWPTTEELHAAKKQVDSLIERHKTALRLVRLEELDFEEKLIIFSEAHTLDLEQLLYERRLNNHYSDETNRWMTCQRVRVKCRMAKEIAALQKQEEEAMSTLYYVRDRIRLLHRN